MSVTGSWRCPLCGEVATDAADHLKAAHGVGGTQDRFGLREAARHGTGRPETPGRDGAGANGTGSNGAGPVGGSDQPLPRPRPRPRRSIRPSRRPDSLDPDVRPARPAPLPPDAAVLRLVCESLDGVDAGALQRRLAELPGIESVTLDLYERTADLFIDRHRAAPPHLVALVMERIGLAVTAAELHRAPHPGQKIGNTTLLRIVH